MYDAREEDVIAELAKAKAESTQLEELLECTCTKVFDSRE